MLDACDAFLQKNPLMMRWLDDIVGVLLNRLHGTAHVREIALELYGERDIDTMEQTVTRRINDFCSDAADFKKAEAYDLFARVRPGTYRLRTYPKKPDIIELIRVEFEDWAVDSVWKSFQESVAKKYKDRWSSLSKRKQLLAFAAVMAEGKPLYEECERRRKAATNLNVTRPQ